MSSSSSLHVPNVCDLQWTGHFAVPILDRFSQHFAPTAVVILAKAWFHSCVFTPVVIVLGLHVVPDIKEWLIAPAQSIAAVDPDKRPRPVVGEGPHLFDLEMKPTISN